MFEGKFSPLKAKGEIGKKIPPAKIYDTSIMFFSILYSSRCHGHQDPHKELLDRNVLMV